MTVTLSVTESTLTVTAGGSGAVVSNSGTSSVTITGTVTQINNLLSTDATSTVSYIDNIDAPSVSATLTLQVSDNGNTGGGSLTNSDTATINLTAVNDAPVVTIVPATYSATEQTNLALHGTGISVADAGRGCSDHQSDHLRRLRHLDRRRWNDRCLGRRSRQLRIGHWYDSSTERPAGRKSWQHHYLR